MFKVPTQKNSVTISKLCHVKKDEPSLPNFFKGVTIKQGNSDCDSEVIICFVLNLRKQQILQLLNVTTVLGFTLRHCHKQLVEKYLKQTFYRPYKVSYLSCKQGNKIHLRMFACTNK